MATLAPRKPASRLVAPGTCVDVAETRSGGTITLRPDCGKRTMRAVMESTNPDGSIGCFPVEVRSGRPIVLDKVGGLRVNYECVVGQDGCAPDRLAQIFPECRAGP